MISIFIWWIRFWLDIAHRVINLFFGVELKFLKTASEKLGSLAVKSFVAILSYFILFLISSIVFFILIFIAKQFILPTNEIRFIPNVIEINEKITGNVLLDFEDDMSIFACYNDNGKKKNEIMNKRDKEIGMQMCDIAKSGDFLPLDLSNNTYEMDVMINIVDRITKRNSSIMNFKLSW